MTETVIVRIMRRRPLTIKWSSDVRVFNIIPNPVFCPAHPSLFSYKPYCSVQAVQYARDIYNQADASVPEYRASADTALFNVIRV